MDETTLEQLRAAATEKRDAAGAPLSDDDSMRFQNMLRRITETEDGHWLWSGRVRAGSPEIAWPGHTWGAMVKRKVWRLATGTEAGGGAISLERRCNDPRCVRPHGDHIALSGYRKGGSNARPAAQRQQSRGRIDANEVAKLVDEMRTTATRLREFGVRITVEIG